MANDSDVRADAHDGAVDAEQKPKLSPTVDFIAGTFAGIAGLVVGYPLDTVKVRFQNAATAQRYRSVAHALATIVREERVGGLFRGITSPMAACAFMNGLVFASYGFLMRAQLVRASDTPSLAQIALAGAGSGVVSSVVTCPSELVKVRQQLVLAGSGRQRGGALAVAAQIVRGGGPRALFRGLGATALRDMGYGAYFATYEGTCRLLRPHATTVDVHVDHSSLAGEAQEEAGLLSWPRLMLAGGVAGVAGWTSTFGFDVVKTRVQATERASAGPYASTLSTIVHSYRADGLKVFFVGLWPTVVRAVPVNMVTFAAFELAVKLLSPLHLPV